MGIARGNNYPPDLARWSWVGRGSSSRVVTPTVLPAATKADVATAGIDIKLRANQALWIRQYRASFVEAAPDNTCFILGGEFGIEIAPFGLGTAIVTFPAFEVAGTLATGAAQGLNLSDIGTDFVLVNHWFAFDESPADGLVQDLHLHTLTYVWNTSAAGKTINAAEGCQYDIYERIFGL